MGRLVDANGRPLPSAEELESGIPDWVRGPVEEWPVGFEVHDELSLQPDRFYLGVPPKRVWVLLDGDWRRHMTVNDLVEVAGGCYEAIAKAQCTRAHAELIARAWVKIAFDWDREQHERTLGEAIHATLH